MIGIIFDQAGEMVEVRVDGNNIYFRTSQTSGMFATLDNLQLNKSGCIKEHPDLKDNDEWREITIQRFKEKIRSLPTENEKMKYIINDLSKHGFVAKYYQKAGHRVVKLV